MASNILSLSLQKVISDCAALDSDLTHARNVESLDTMTSNRSLAGFFVTLWSSTKNRGVAAKLDQLGQDIDSLNQELARHNLPQLAITLGGRDIRKAENAEHEFFNFRRFILGSEAHEGLASLQTREQLVRARERVRVVKEVAEALLQQTNMDEPAARLTSIRNHIECPHCGHEADVVQRTVERDPPAQPTVKIVTRWRDREPENRPGFFRNLLGVLFCVGLLTYGLNRRCMTQRSFFPMNPFVRW